MNKNTFLKGFLPLVSATLLWGGCSNDKTLTDDTVPYAVVGFRVQGTSPSTRAGSTGTGQVNAVIVNGRMTDESGARSEVLLDGSTLYRLKGTENHFDYSPHVYFPSWAKHASFAAYSPASSRVGSESFTVSDNVISYSVPSPAKGDLIGDVDVAPQEDLLVAAKETKQEDFVAPVVLNMHHALSRVHVRARNMMVYPVIIEKLSLHNLYNSGTLKIDSKSWNKGDEVDIDENYVKPTDVEKHDDYKVLWTPTGDPNKALAWQLAESGVTAPVGVSTVQVTADDQAMLVMPQTTINTDGDADFYLEVTYTVQDYGSYTKCCAFRDVNGLDGGLTFEMGRQYALTLTFTADKLTFNVSVNDWDKTDGEVVLSPIVEFKANKPEEEATDVNVTGIHESNSGFITGQALPTLTGAVPTLPGWRFLGYYDDPENGTQYFDVGEDGKLIVAAPNGTFNGTTWDKPALPIQYLYAQWECLYVEIGDLKLKWARFNVGIPYTFAPTPYEAGMFYQWGSNVGWSSSGTPTSHDGTTENTSPTWNSNPPSGSWEIDGDPGNQGPCPDGWRLPTGGALGSGGELESLNNAGFVWGKYAALGDGSAINGCWFGTAVLATAQASPMDFLFLPASGFRSGNLLSSRGSGGLYWSSSVNDASGAYYMFFIDSGDVNPTGIGGDFRAFGQSVRCVLK